MIPLWLKALIVFTSGIVLLGGIAVVGNWSLLWLNNKRRSAKYSKDTGTIAKGLLAKKRIDNQTMGLWIDRHNSKRTK